MIKIYKLFLKRFSDHYSFRKTLEEISDLNERLNLQAQRTLDEIKFSGTKGGVLKVHAFEFFFHINNFIHYYILQNYEDQ